MKALKRYQKRYGISQKYMAELAGVSEFQMCRWLKGKQVPNITSLRKLAKRLGIPLADLL